MARRQPTQEEAAIEAHGIPAAEAAADKTTDAWRRFYEFERETRPQPRIAADYVHTKHPDTGLQVVFVPGETLPAWAVTHD
ncbi:MAG: hypothetical protein Q7T15_09300 [Microcella sp.]|uniref:hypothetical protein n=1 Tax=Microcella sp. TaxID=1913979 RepID=UPI00272107C0|nr:hypothetical protein [Microcella sp.]MDO8338433.1 hypothetical protein [Microcella sp.]